MRAAMLILFVSSLVFGAAVSAATLKVPSEFATIQGAVDAAASGDTILVSPGTYVESPVVFYSKNSIHVLGAAGREETEIRGDLTLEHSSKIIVKGFAITGRVSLLCDTRCAVSDCDVSASSGSGIVVTGCPGGAYSDVDIRGNRIHDNPGHGVEGELSGGKAAIVGNEIRNNGGSGVSVTHSYCEISGNVIWGNEESGVEIAQGTSAVNGNTIAMNDGSGIRITSGGAPLTQTIVADIVALNGTAGIYGDAGGVYSISCCDVWNNGAAGGFNYAGAIPDHTGVAGTISADPLFCGLTSGNLTLMEGSPALVQSCGAMGAEPDPGCASPDAARETTWGRLKSIYGK